MFASRLARWAGAAFLALAVIVCAGIARTEAQQPPLPQRSQQPSRARGARRRLKSEGRSQQLELAHPDTSPRPANVAAIAKRTVDRRMLGAWPRVTSPQPARKIQ